MLLRALAWREERRLPRPFVTYAWLTAGLATWALITLAIVVPPHVDNWLLFVLLSGFVLAGELLPIDVPKRARLDTVTVSAAFALALLMRFGPVPSIAVYAGSLVVADLAGRVTPLKILFNAAQYALSLGSAAAIILLAGWDFPVHLDGGSLPVVLLAIAVSFMVNHLLACVGGALLARVPVGHYLREDLGFQAWTAGSVIAFAPVVMTAADRGAALVPVAFMPMIAVYLGGRQAAMNTHRAFHDALTDLPNRTLLAEELTSALDLAAHEHGELAVMILDLDDFKAINDTLGHEIGDLVLQQISTRLAEACADAAVLARLGGDEFAVVVHAGREAAEVLAVQLLAAINRPLSVESLMLEMRGSLGIACYPQHGDDVHDLLRHADVALYCAKNANRGYEVYSAADDDNSIDRLVLASHLRRGIERDELVVHYQPKVPLNGGPVRAVEALVRWEHPQLGRISPDGFIPLAEQSGLIKPLTLSVLRTALRQSELWRRDGLNVRISVNISTRSLLDHDLPDAIEGLLSEFDVQSSALQLEITESRMVSDLGRARSVLEELRAMGVTIAIDDFGTGFSSLSQLQQLPIDEIKIDRSFVSRMETVRADAALVRSIIDLGRNLGLRVTAEGVESESTVQEIRSLGCDYAQGFHVGMPMSADECRKRHLEIQHPLVALEATVPARPLLVAEPSSA